MELWIRSQDKETLKKINNIEIDFLNFKKYSYTKDIESKGEYSIRGNGETIGQYKSKERALEVLDEIQNMIKPTLITTQYHSEIKQGVDKLSFDVIMQPVEDKITYIQPDTVIYEMPEE